MRFNRQLCATNRLECGGKKYLKPKAKVFIIYWKFPSLFNCDEREEGKKKSPQARRISADSRRSMEHFSSLKK